MISIKKHFYKYGHTFELVKTGKNSLIYKQQSQGKTIAFEVHKIRTRSTRIINGQILNKCIWLPTDEDFGKWAWSFMSFEKALLKFNDLEKKLKFKN